MQGEEPPSAQQQARRRRSRSALPSQADILRVAADVRLVPDRTFARRRAFPATASAMIVKLSRVGPPQAVVRSKLHLGERAAFPTRRGYASALIQTNGAACWL